MLLKPKPITITDMDGVDRDFILSRFPAVQGREIVTQYPMNNIPRVSSYPQSEEIMMKLMSYVGVSINGQESTLSSMALINNHTGDPETLMKLEWEMMKYNSSFFQNGNPFISLTERCLTFLQKIIETLTLSSEQSSAPNKPASTNSGQSTT